MMYFPPLFSIFSQRAKSPLLLLTVCRFVLVFLQPVVHKNSPRFPLFKPLVVHSYKEWYIW